MGSLAAYAPASRDPASPSSGALRSQVRAGTLAGLVFRMLIRTVHESDLPELARLYVAVFNAPPWNDGWSIDTAHERIRRIATNPSAVGVVARDGDLPVSFALGTLEQWTKGEHFHLRKMCTAIGQQRRGIGAAVLEALVRELTARSVEVVFLETHPGSSASAFYRKQGFSPLNLEMLRRRLGVGPRTLGPQ